MPTQAPRAARLWICISWHQLIPCSGIESSVRVFPVYPTSHCLRALILVGLHGSPRWEWEPLGSSSMAPFGEAFLFFIRKPSLVKSEVSGRIVWFSRHCVFPWPNQFRSQKRLGAWQAWLLAGTPCRWRCSLRGLLLCSHKGGGWASLQKIIHTERKKTTANAVNVIIFNYLSRCLEAFFKRLGSVLNVATNPTRMWI